LPIKAFVPENVFRFNNYQRMTVGDGMSTGEKIT